MNVVCQNTLCDIDKGVVSVLPRGSGGGICNLFAVAKIGRAKLFLINSEFF